MESTEKNPGAGDRAPLREADPERLISAWLTHVESGWAWSELGRLATDDPDRFLALARELVARSRGEADLSALGQGALGTLLRTHGEGALEKLAAEAGRDPRWRTAILAVDLGRLDPELSSRLRRRFDIITEGTE